jgi:hypothetical protein
LQKGPKSDNYNLLNPSMMDDDSERDLGKEMKRKKVIKYAIIGSISLIILVLAIVLPIVLTKGSDDNPVDPPPKPKPPVLPNSTNEYHVEEASIQIGTFYESGQIKV